MKKLFQLFLFILLILISFFFYKKYFQPNKITEKIEIEKQQEIINENKNNLIKNLKYDIKLDDDTQYNIVADYSELIYENEIEIVEMQTVFAVFIDANNIPLTIRSDFATYNNSNYNTKFYNNVIIEYMEHVITSKNADINFSENITLIYNNVVYDGLQGALLADNVAIDMITKNVEIFMNNSKNKIEVNVK